MAVNEKGFRGVLKAIYGYYQDTGMFEAFLVNDSSCRCALTLSHAPSIYESTACDIAIVRTRRKLTTLPRN
jgi:hypothetical protein